MRDNFGALIIFYCSSIQLKLKDFNTFIIMFIESNKKNIEDNSYKEENVFIINIINKNVKNVKNKEQNRTEKNSCEQINICK